MSKDRISTPDFGAASETEMSEEILAARTPFQAALLAAGRTDGLTPDRKEKLFRNLSVAVGAPHLFGEGTNEPSGFDDITGAAQASPDTGAADAGPTNLPADPSSATRGALEATVKSVDGLGPLASAAKLASAVAVTGALVWGGWQALGPSPTESAPRAGAAVVDVLRTVEEPVAQPAVESTGVVEPVARPEAAQLLDTAVPDDSPGGDEELSSAVRGARSKAKVSDSLAKELSLIDSARAALLRGEPSVALRTLNAYRAQFPRGALRAEATVQRVEALIATGDRASAATIGNAFLKRHPESPYSRRIASLLGREPQVDGARKSK